MSEQFLENASNFEQILESVGFGVCLINFEGKIKFSNLCLTEILEIPLGDIKDQSLLELVSDSSGTISQYLSSKTKEPLLEHECKISHSEKQKYIHLNFEPFYRDGEITGYVCSARDSTQVLQLRYSLIQEYAFQSEVSELSRDLKASDDLNEIAEQLVNCVFHHSKLLMAGLVYVHEHKQDEINVWECRQLDNNFEESEVVRLQKLLTSRINPVLIYTKNKKTEFDPHEAVQWTSEDFEETSVNRHKILESLEFFGIPFQIKDHGRGFIIGCSEKDSLAQEDETRLQYISGIVSSLFRGVHLLEQIQEKNEILGNAVEKLQNAEMLREQFYRFLMHDLNKPLAAISGTASRMMKKDLDENLRTRLNRIYRSSAKLQGYVGEFLDFERIRRGDVNYSIKAFDAVHELLEACETIQERYEHSTIKFRSIKISHVMSAEMKFDEMILESDANFIHRVFLNVLDNGAKYGNGLINADIIEKNGFLEVSIWNNGEPISKQAMEKLFVEFYQQGKQTSGSYGIGLASVKQLVQNLCGRIKVQPEEDGTTFIIVLPCQWMKSARVIDMEDESKSQ